MSDQEFWLTAVQFERLAPLQPVRTRLTVVDLAAHEWVGLAAYRLQGRTDRLLPGPDTMQQP